MLECYKDSERAVQTAPGESGTCHSSRRCPKEIRSLACAALCIADASVPIQQA